MNTGRIYGEKKHEVVISGLSGLYPECDDVEELWDKLMKKEDMVSIDGRRWLPGEFDVPPGTGKIRHTEYFDMTFFGIHKKLCEKMDPFTRLLCEQGYRAICDAGVNPRDLDGTNAAVIMTSSTAETVLDLGAALLNQGSYNVLAFSRTMQANRLSYFLNLKGPSFQMDNTNCGGIEAIQYACDLISTGMCTAAIVGSCSLLFKGEASFHYQMMGRLSEDSSTRSFSSDASGFARSEGCVTVFLQRKEHAKRIYGTVLGTNIFCHGSKEIQFADFPRGRHEDFLVETFRNANVKPESITYVEAYGSASKTLDALELNSIAKVMKNRSNPLLIGSIKSNLGHTEGCSSMVSLTKVLMALNKGIIPPNINYSGPNPNVPDLLSGKLKVVTEPTPLKGDIVAISELGVTGNCSAIVLKGSEKNKQPRKEPGLPYLLTMSGRKDTALEKNLKDMESTEVDAELAVLLNTLYKHGIKNHAHRGYTVISDEPNHYNMVGPAPVGERRPVWFMFSGMGSQWPTMAKSLMALPIFARAIEKCHKILEPKGVNLLDIVCKDDPTIFDNILHSFVGIAAVQIGLTDVLRAIGVEPDGIIGHSVGELGCAYADGCMTAEQMVLAAHARGRASIEATLTKGMMAAVGAGYNQMKNIIPENIEVACHNSKDSCTLSGPADEMAAYIDQLKAKGMFAKLVNVANIAYHSKYIKPAAPALLKYLKEILPEPAKRSSRWVSSSNLECNWDTHLAQHSSAEYHTNNLLSSVLFEEASSHIPKNAIIIEIAPHGLMQAIVKRSFPHAVHIPLTSRFDTNNLMFLLGAIGKMFVAGIPVDLQKLYPSATFPVARGTPAISPLIDWSREVNFVIARAMEDVDAESLYCRTIAMNPKLENFNELSSHKINGTGTVPSGFYFKEMMTLFTSFESNVDHPIVIEKIKFSGFVEINSRSSTELRFKLLHGTGNIVVTDSKTSGIILEANIRTADEKAVDKLKTPAMELSSGGISNDSVAVLMRCLGLDRDSSLISLKNVIIDNNHALAIVQWEGDIAKFLTSLLALVEFVESTKANALKMFHSAEEIMLNLPFLFASNNSKEFLIQYDIINKELQGAGVRIASIECRHFKMTQQMGNTSFFLLERSQFVPYVNNLSLSFEQCAHICAQLIFENLQLEEETMIKITEIGDNSKLHDALDDVHKSVKHSHLTSLTSFSTEEEFHQQCTSSLFQKDLWIVCAEPPSAATLRSFESVKNGFVMAPKCAALPDNMRVVFETLVDDRSYCLYAIKNPIKRQYEVVNLDSGYLGNLEKKLAAAGKVVDGAVKTVILWGQVESMIAIEDILEKTIGLPNGIHLQYWLFLGCAPEYNFYEPQFKSQIEKDVRMNIMENGNWGSARLFPCNAKREIACVTPSKFYYPLSAVFASRNILTLGLNVEANQADTSVAVLGCYDYVTSNEEMGVGIYEPDNKAFVPDPNLKWQKPKQWTPKEAATVPLLYSLASYILHQTNNAEYAYKDSILVTRALLPLSQAVIALALYENMKVHVTVYGDKEKQKLLEIFPKLNSKFVYDCSSIGFYVDVLKNSEGGVYKVINNFDDSVMVEPCASCTLPLGVLVYTSQRLVNNGTAMGMLTFNNEVVARGVSTSILMSSSSEIKSAIKDRVKNAIDAGGVVPIQAETLPPSTLNTEAVEYLTSVPNKVVVDANDNAERSFHQGNSMPIVIVEGKQYVDLCLDILEWVLKRGSQKIVYFSEQNLASEASRLRLQSLREQYNNADIKVQPVEQFSTKPKIEKFIDDYCASGPAVVFFLGSDLSENISLFDDVSSSKMPGCNIICIGKGGESVCERRNKKSLQALHIRCSTGCSLNLVSYLDGLIKDSSQTPVVLVKKYEVSRRRALHGLMSNLKYVPQTAADLNRLMARSKGFSKATFVSVPSAGPGIKFNRDVYPMFLISGLRPNRLNELASRLYCPAAEARIPETATSITQIADDLAAQLLALPHNMYTLCAEDWGGILALHVASKLKAKSKYVNVVLLDASPASVSKWAKSLLENETALLRKYLPVPPEVESEAKNSSWEEELKHSISLSKSTAHFQSASATDCLNLLRRRLQSVVDAPPPEEKLDIKCHLYQLESHASESHGLHDYLLNEPTVHTIDSASDLIMDKDVAQEVNTLLLYEHKDAANPPIEEYLGCNIIKKYLPHWQASLLYRVRQ